MNVPSKKHIIGNTIITVHSPLVTMSEAEREKRFQDEFEKGNPVVVNTLRKWYGK